MAAAQKRDGTRPIDCAATPNLRATARPRRRVVSPGAVRISKHSTGPEVVEVGLAVALLWGWGGGVVAAVVVGRINISATWPLKPLPMTANIMKRYGSREGERNEKDKKRTVK